MAYQIPAGSFPIAIIPWMFIVSVSLYLFIHNIILYINTKVIENLTLASCSISVAIWYTYQILTIFISPEHPRIWIYLGAAYFTGISSAAFSFIHFPLIEFKTKIGKIISLISILLLIIYSTIGLIGILPIGSSSSYSLSLLGHFRIYLLSYRNPNIDGPFFAVCLIIAYFHFAIAIIKPKYKLENKMVFMIGSAVILLSGFNDILVGLRFTDKSVTLSGFGFIFFVGCVTYLVSIRYYHLDKLNKKLNEKLEERVIEKTAALKATNKELETFSYSVSHDLRAPLRSLDGFSQALLEDYGDQIDDMGKDFLHRIRAASKRMANLIDDLLKLSRLTRSKMNKKEINLSEIVKQIANNLKQNEPDRIVEFKIESDIKAKCDERLIKIVLENLIENSWKFTNKKSSALIEFGATSDSIILSKSLTNKDNIQKTIYIKDNGAGFDPEYKEKLFGAFQRLHTEKEFNGIGIGLATVQRIIHRHGGTIWADAKVNEGATFYFVI